ncbi:hypothetical protein Rhe02_25510 [Rhizocola hellebori]|uniref:Uncharacterized protein n=1 Tax=Rhizocola hellebori TaxID=1392758 RepID=A0A8J3Q5V6_9ACTN|nr:hypothetical protein [Rhizocola hellebori]GIH04484.1 hypothetical protein Rhe02_25510 [Rhizocola hellebori]
MTPLTRVRIWIVLFVICLVLSGVTAFPLLAEVRWVSTLALPEPLADWINEVKVALEATPPLMFYGTDWLAFAHIVIGLAFIGPYRDPVRNIWVIEWAMLCCVAIIPLAFIAGPIRGIPFWWQLIDISFGIFGLIPLWIVRREILKLANR